MENYNILPMKKMPADDRPYEKLQRHGARALSDAELLSIIIRNGTKSMPALSLSQKIISESGDLGLLMLNDASLEELMSISGIGRVKALQIKAAIEIGNRTFEKARNQNRRQIKNPDDAVGLLEEQMRCQPREELQMILLDTRHRVIKIIRLSSGGLSSAVIQPRDVFREAVKANAAAVILAHNHPSGDFTPSSDDISTTLKLREVGDLMGVRIIDHIIISTAGIFSMKQQGLI
jgi:DNA repair protein RadC